jgi:hypothetical protein
MLRVLSDIGFSTLLLIQRLIVLLVVRSVSVSVSVCALVRADLMDRTFTVKTIKNNCVLYNCGPYLRFAANIKLISFIEIPLKIATRGLNISSANKLRGFSPQANYTDRATAACRRS